MAFISDLRTGAFTGGSGEQAISEAMYAGLPVVAFSHPPEQEIISHMVIGTSLGIIVFSSISSTYSHNRRKVVVWDLIKIVGPSIFIGSALGAITADQLSSETLRSLIAIFLILVSIQMAFQFPPPKQNPSTTVAGPLTVGPTIAAPIAPIPAGKKLKSFSRVNTPGDTIDSAILLLFYILFNIFYIFHLDINIKRIYKPKLL